MAGVDTTEKEKCVENLEKAFKEFFIPSPDERDRNDLDCLSRKCHQIFCYKSIKS